jgi:hypothetical protein
MSDRDALAASCMAVHPVYYRDGLIVRTHQVVCERLAGHAGYHMTVLPNGERFGFPRHTSEAVTPDGK